MKAKFSVDRIEDGKYVLVSYSDPAKQVVWPSDAMPAQLREGDIVNFDIEVDEAGRKEAEQEVRRLIEELLSRPSPKKSAGKKKGAGKVAGQS